MDPSAAPRGGAQGSGGSVLGLEGEGGTRRGLLRPPPQFFRMVS